MILCRSGSWLKVFCEFLSSGFEVLGVDFRL